MSPESGIVWVAFGGWAWPALVIGKRWPPVGLPDLVVLAQRAGGDYEPGPIMVPLHCAFDTREAALAAGRSR